MKAAALMTGFALAGMSQAQSYSDWTDIAEIEEGRELQQADW